MELQAKKKSLWGTFKNAYLRQKNLKKFWNKLDKSKLPKDLIETFNLYINSPSYNWSSKFWRHVMMLHLNLIASGKYKNYENIMSRLYFTWVEMEEDLINNSCKEIQNNKIDLKVNLFKKQENLNWTASINHNLIFALQYHCNLLKRIQPNKNYLRKYYIFCTVPFSDDYQKN